jgi:O-methyltransferase involved in polyketide biosynthesis
MKAKSNLKDVPETMLWTLHNRVTEAMREDGIIKDEKAVAIYQSIDYDYAANFGKAETSHAVRSLIFDREVKRFLENPPKASSLTSATAWKRNSLESPAPLPPG